MSSLGSILKAYYFYGTVGAIQEGTRSSTAEQNAKPPGEGAYTAPTTTESRPTPLLFGRTRIRGLNTIWWGDREERALKRSFSSGFGSTRQIVGYEFLVGLQLTICRGETRSVGTLGQAPVNFHKLWLDDRLLVEHTSPGDATIVINDPFFFGGATGTGGAKGTIVFKSGTQDQVADPYLIPFQNPITPHRGDAQLIFHHFNFGTAGVIPEPSVEVSRYPTFLWRAANNLGLTVYDVDHVRIGLDLNPMEAMYEAIIDNEWGRNQSNRVNVESFAIAAETLYNEGLGFSMHIDEYYEFDAFKRVIEEHCDCYIYTDKKTGEWTVALSRADESTTPPRIEPEDVHDFADLTRQEWLGTTNSITIEFQRRDLDYGVSYVPSKNEANRLQQDGRTEHEAVRLPGCKEATVANVIGARLLSARSYPLLKCTLVVNRKHRGINPGDVRLVDFPGRGLTNVRMRAISVDLGAFDDGRIAIPMIQDINSVDIGFFGTPQIPLWQAPSEALEEFDSDDVIVIEAPRKVVELAEVLPGIPHRLLFSARRDPSTSAASGMQLYQRSAEPGPPTGAFGLDGDTAILCLVGVLQGDISKDTANPNASIVLDESVSRLDTGSLGDTMSTIVERTADATATQVGQQLANLALVGSELIAFETFSDGGAVMALNTVYRGMMCTVPADHPAGSPVFLLYVGVGINESTIPIGSAVEAKAIPFSSRGILAESAVLNVESLTMQNRYNRPYPPVLQAAPTNINLDLVVSGVGTGAQITIKRRDYLNTDEVVAINSDDPAVDASTQYRTSATDVVTGDLLFRSGWQTISTPILFVSRGDILVLANGEIPAGDVTIQVDTRHTVGGEVLEALQSPSFDSPVSTNLPAQNLGTVFPNVASAAYTVATDVGHVVTLDSHDGEPLDLEYRVDGGSWVAISSGGTIPAASISVSSEIQFRHATVDDGPAVVLILDDNSSTLAYAVLSRSSTLDSLAGYWNLDESSGTRARKFGVGGDLAESGGSVVAVPGIFGNGVEFDGLTRLEASTTAPYYPDGDFSVCFWAKPAAGSFDSATNIYATIGNGGGTDRLFEMKIRSGGGTFPGQWEFLPFTQNAGVDSPGALSDAAAYEDEWQFVCGTYDASDGTTEIYVIRQGEAIEVGNTNTALSPFGPRVGVTQPLAVGSAAGLVAPVLDGQMDELRIYHRILTPTEIEEIAAQTSPL